MRKLIIGCVVIAASGLAMGQMVTYLDAKGKPIAYALPVGNQTVIMNDKAQPIAYAMPQPISVPNLVFPVTEPQIPRLTPMDSPHLMAFPSLMEFPK